MSVRLALGFGVGQRKASSGQAGRPAPRPNLAHKRCATKKGRLESLPSGNKRLARRLPAEPDGGMNVLRLSPARFVDGALGHHVAGLDDDALARQAAGELEVAHTHARPLSAGVASI